MKKRDLTKLAVMLAAGVFSVALLGTAAGCGSGTAEPAPTPAANETPAPAPVKTTTVPVEETGHSKPPMAEKLEPYTCGTVQRLHTLGGVFLASQPAADDFKQAAEAGVKTVIDLRKPGENKEFDEPELVKSLGLEYINLPFNAADELTPGVLDGAREVLNNKEKLPVLMKCNSGNRVGAVWLAHRVLDGHLSWDEAMAEAKMVGLKTPAYEGIVKAYVEAKTAK